MLSTEGDEAVAPDRLNSSNCCTSCGYSLTGCKAAHSIPVPVRPVLDPEEMALGLLVEAGDRNCLSDPSPSSPASSCASSSWPASTAMARK